LFQKWNNKSKNAVFRLIVAILASTKNCKALPSTGHKHSRFSSFPFACNTHKVQVLRSCRSLLWCLLWCLRKRDLHFYNSVGSFTEVSHAVCTLAPVPMQRPNLERLRLG
jgi:hypothetical protein